MFSPKHNQIYRDGSAFTATDSGNTISPITGFLTASERRPILYLQGQPDSSDDISATTRAFLTTFLRANQLTAPHDVPVHVWRELQVFCDRMITHHQRHSSQHAVPQSFTLGINCAIPDVLQSSSLGLPSPVSPISDQHHSRHPTDYFWQRRADQWTSGAQDLASDAGFCYGHGMQQVHASHMQTSTMHDNDSVFALGNQGRRIPSLPSLISPNASFTGDVSTFPYNPVSSTIASGPVPSPDTRPSSNVALIVPMDMADGNTSPTSVSDPVGHSDSGSVICPIPCLWTPPCSEHIPSASEKDIEKHLRDKHPHDTWQAAQDAADDRVPCRWDNCSHPKRFKVASLARHIAGPHLRSMRVQCEQCGEEFSRPDSLRRHTENPQACHRQVPAGPITA